MSPEHPKWFQVQADLKDSQMNLQDIRLSGKLLALKYAVRMFYENRHHISYFSNRELLIECGIGVSKDAVVSAHRALVFCQMKTMIDVIVSQVLA